MECYYSRHRLLGLALLNTLMLAGACACLFSPKVVAVIAGWAGIVLCSLAYVAVVKLFCRTGPQVIVSDAGIDDRRCAVGLIPWEDIEAVSVASVASTKFLCLHLREPGKYLGKLSKGRRTAGAIEQSLGAGHFPIGFVGLTPPVSEVIAFIAQRYRVARSGMG